MTVGELLELLRDCDPDSRVLLVSQPSWPFEYSIEGVALRGDFEEADTAERRPDDVFIVEGTQLRYGSRAAWDACR